MDMDRRGFLTLGLIAGATALLPLTLSGCGDSTTTTSSLPQNDYDWSRLAYVDGRAVYTGSDGKKALTGIDVSDHDGDIDWEKVAADGIDYAMIRVGNRGYTEGGISDDDNFTYNIEHAIAAGLPVGVYFFSQAISTAEAIEEADHTIAVIKSYDVKYPVVFDYEEVGVSGERTEKLTAAERTKITKAFCERVSAKGYTPMVYGNGYWFSDKVELASLIEDYNLWLAQYDSQPSPTYKFAMWQYTDGGTVAGTDGVDISLCFKDYAGSGA